MAKEDPQQSADLELRAHFAEQPRPALSADFQLRLQERLELEAQRTTARTLRRILLPAYWLIACTTSFFILGGLEWGAGAAVWPWLLVCALSWIAFGPIAALARRFQLDIFDLIFIPNS